MRILLLFLVIACASRAADVTVPFAPPAAWVDRLPDPPLTPTPTADASYGYDYLLLDRQIEVEDEAVYGRNVYRITSEGSLQSGARLTWNFDPAYERLTLHHLRVTRDGVTQDRLREGLVQIIQQERDLDRHLLNGELTALVVLEDIRVGDVIDYAYTRRGWNPAFAGHYFDTLAAGWAIPVRHERFRISAPATRSIAYKPSGSVSLAFTGAREGDRQVLTWEGRELRPIEAESELPSWFNPYPVVRLTEFTRWSEVVQWAEPLYALPEPLAPALVEKAAELTRGRTSDDDKAVAILQFVQQEIRYLGMELGAGSYRPTAPAVVLARRFGDCKDKTLLFCALMQAAGLSAYPALLHTDWRDRLDDWLPSPQAFDHVIAALPREDGYLWVDPTLTYQQGDLARRGLPDYRRALVVRPGEEGLTHVKVPATARSRVRIAEHFESAAFDQPAQFQVTTTYSGLGADAERRYFAQTTPEQIAKAYVNYYASAYPGIRSVKPPTLTEDAKNNIVTIVESYEVAKLWSEPDASRTLKAEFFPKIISDYAARPQSALRSMPLSVGYPADVQQTTVVTLPETWRVTPGETIIESDAFRAKQGIAGEGNVVTMTYGWETLADHVPVGRMSRHVEDLNRYRNGLGYSLTYTKPAPAGDGAKAEAKAAEAYRLNGIAVAAALFAFAATAYAGLRAWRWKFAGPPSVVDSRLEGLRGWLILVAIGVVVRPFTFAASFVATLKTTFNPAVWDVVTTPGSAVYHEGWGALLVGEVAGNTVLTTGSLVLAVLFFGRKRAFPTIFIALIAFLVIFVTLDTVLAAWLLGTAAPNSPEAYKPLGQALVQAAIWIPYMCLSKRVRATFIR